MRGTIKVVREELQLARRQVAVVVEEAAGEMKDQVARAEYDLQVARDAAEVAAKDAASRLERKYERAQHDLATELATTYSTMSHHRSMAEGLLAECEQVRDPPLTYAALPWILPTLLPYCGENDITVVLLKVSM